jgi:hypothetical protein
MHHTAVPDADTRYARAALSNLAVVLSAIPHALHAIPKAGSKPKLTEMFL